MTTLFVSAWRLYRFFACLQSGYTDCICECYKGIFRIWRLFIMDYYYEHTRLLPLGGLKTAHYPKEAQKEEKRPLILPRPKHAGKQHKGFIGQARTDAGCKMQSPA
ncbi:MAG TPA: hypothetical protein PLS97_08225 [Rectinema sp.]|nr:hypothetical protein [Rectinema sp.]HPL72058.1 hypothetical protein [Rectinema sp.]